MVGFIYGFSSSSKIISWINRRDEMYDDKLSSLPTQPVFHLFEVLYGKLGRFMATKLYRIDILILQNLFHLPALGSHQTLWTFQGQPFRK